MKDQEWVWWRWSDQEEGSKSGQGGVSRENEKTDRIGSLRGRSKHEHLRIHDAFQFWEDESFMLLITYKYLTAIQIVRCQMEEENVPTDSFAGEYSTCNLRLLRIKSCFDGNARGEERFLFFVADLLIHQPKCSLSPSVWNVFQG